MGCKKRSWARVMIVIMVVVCGWSSAAAQSPAQCKQERRDFVNACKQVLYRPPSPQCCERVRVSHAECICPAVTPQRAALIDVPRAIRLIEGCGRRVPHHFQCGSITTP